MSSAEIKTVVVIVDERISLTVRDVFQPGVLDLSDTSGEFSTRINVGDHGIINMNEAVSSTKCLADVIDYVTEVTVEGRILSHQQRLAVRVTEFS